MEAIKPACWQSLGGHSLTKAREAHHRKVLGEAAALFTKDISICLFEDSIPLASLGNPLTGTHLCLTAEAAADSPWPLSHVPVSLPKLLGSNLSTQLPHPALSSQTGSAGRLQPSRGRLPYPVSLSCFCFSLISFIGCDPWLWLRSARNF